MLASKQLKLICTAMLLSWLILLVACNSKTTRTPTRPVEQTPTLGCDDGKPTRALDPYPLLPGGAGVQPVDLAQALQVIATLRGYSAQQSRAYLGAVDLIAELSADRRFTHRCLNDARRRGIIN